MLTSVNLLNTNNNTSFGTLNMTHRAKGSLNNLIKKTDDANLKNAALNLESAYKAVQKAEKDDKKNKFVITLWGISSNTGTINLTIEHFAKAFGLFKKMTLKTPGTTIESIKPDDLEKTISKHIEKTH